MLVARNAGLLSVLLLRKVSVPTEMPGSLFHAFSPADATSLAWRLSYEAFIYLGVVVLT